MNVMVFSKLQLSSPYLGKWKGGCESKLEETDSGIGGNAEPMRDETPGPPSLSGAAAV